jgi:hypothetical protein
MTTVELTNFPSAIELEVLLLIRGIYFPTAAAGVNNIPLELWTEDSSGNILESRIFFNYISPTSISTVGGSPTLSISNSVIQGNADYTIQTVSVPSTGIPLNGRIVFEFPLSF